MTHRQKQVVRDSFQSISEIAGPLSLLFYGRLFQLDPTLRRMFHGDIALQGRKLMDMLAAVVDHLDRLDNLTPVLHAMGQRHVAYGVLPKHYETVESALLWALSQALDRDFDAETKAAWQAVVAGVAKVMKEGAAELPPSA